MKCHDMTRTAPRAILLENHMKKKYSLSAVRAK